MSSSRVRALLDDAATARRVATAVGCTGWDGDITVEPVSCELTNLTTEALDRVHFGSSAAAPSAVAKVAQSPRHSQVWNVIPEHFRAQVLEELPWQSEAAFYASRLPTLLPSGLRTPIVYGVDQLGDDRLVIWMEDVATRADEWRDDDYATAARAFGRLAGRFPERGIPHDIPATRRDFRGYAAGRLGHEVLPLLRDDQTWLHPRLATVVDPRLRADLDDLARALPEILDRLDALPRTLTHGDACPQNLLRPPDGAPVVAIDWTFVGVCALGIDAAQLLAGNAEAAELDPAELPRLLDLIVNAYAAGLQDEGTDVDLEQVRFGVVANLVVRSAFTALPVERLDAEDLAPTFFLRRAAYARFLVDVGLQLCAPVRY